jgi:hypothetical protein
VSGKPFSEKQCTATSKRTGERCEAWRMKGKEVGYHHGGKSPIGAGSATFKDGRHSKYRAIFSGNALEHYEAACQDLRYAKLREEIALLDALTIEELERAKNRRRRGAVAASRREQRAQAPDRRAADDNGGLGYPEALRWERERIISGSVSRPVPEVQPFQSHVPETSARKGETQMTKYVETTEEKAFDALLDEKRDEISEAARGLVELAAGCSYDHNLCRNYAFQPEEFYVAEHNMLHLAYALTEHDREALADVAQAAKAASDSLDRSDSETSAGFRICIADLHYYYAMTSGMIEDALKPTDRREIDSAQFALWREYGESWACPRAGAE